MRGKLSPKTRNPCTRMPVFPQGGAVLTGQKATVTPVNDPGTKQSQDK